MTGMFLLVVFELNVHDGKRCYSFSCGGFLETRIEQLIVLPFALSIKLHK